ncbi:MAG TPA: ABC transporter permease [Candidatus Limnocylindrales bacterium]|nr:ABC transporter permease [Candidatus Limnocylindrales bacterium]
MTDAADTRRAATIPAPAAPTLRGILVSLLRADAIVQLRNGRALALGTVLPLVLLWALFAAKRATTLGDPLFLVASCLSLGMASMAVLGYSITVARDRETGVLQRLRVTPAPTWAIMLSRLIVQVVAMMAMAVVVLAAAFLFEHVELSPIGYVLTIVVLILASAVFLSIGQLLVGLIASADTLSAGGRLIYMPLVVLGVFGHTSLFGTTFEMVSRWSPSGVASSLMSGAMDPGASTGETWLAVVAAAAYTVVFAGIGIRWFRWTVR